MDVAKEAYKLFKDLRQVLHFSGESHNVDLLVSSLTEYNSLYTTEEIHSWLAAMNKMEFFAVEEVPLSDLRQWCFDQWTGDLCHESGGFFSIKGIQIQTNVGPVKEWTQPIIDQPEIGVLGIIAKKINGILYFLMQAKAEPGNINAFQLSPTVQATRSNYLRFHGGKSIRYLEYFFDIKKSKVLIDQLQSEQGARFYRKRNRNIVIQLHDDVHIDEHPNFRWLTLGQIKHLIHFDNTVNMDARSILSCISFTPQTVNDLLPVHEDDLLNCIKSSKIVSEKIGLFNVKMIVSAHENSPSCNTFDSLLHKITRGKFNCELSAKIIPLNEVKDWQRTPYEISHVEGKFFSVIGVRVSASNREVASWDQPIIQQRDSGLTGFIIREFEGISHFLVQLKMESGNMDLLEFAPSVQCITGSYSSDNQPPFVQELLDPSSDVQIIYDTMQSEEGGRFYREENRNMIVENNNLLSGKERTHYLWMNMNQLKLFLKFNNLLNVESRSLLSLI